LLLPLQLCGNGAAILAASLNPFARSPPIWPSAPRLTPLGIVPKNLPMRAKDDFL
jgi:hypothetical protein